MNKLGIWAITIVFAFALGTVFSADIATATKPITEVFVKNTEPIPVTQIVSTSTHTPALFLEGIAFPDGCQPGQTNGNIQISMAGGSANIGSANLRSNVVTDTELSETSFLIKGYTKLIIPDCVSGHLEVPSVFTITGDCGEGVTINITTEGGVSATGTADVLCLP